MLKKLFDFKLSKPMKIAKIIMLVCIAAALVIAFLGLREIVDAKHMKALLGVQKIVFADVLAYLLKKYVSWAALIAVGGAAGYFITRYVENNKAA